MKEFSGTSQERQRRDGVVCRKDFPKVRWVLTQAAACALRAACSKLSVSRLLGCRKVGVGGATPFGFCRKEAEEQRV